MGVCCGGESSTHKCPHLHKQPSAPTQWNFSFHRSCTSCSVIQGAVSARETQSYPGSCWLRVRSTEAAEAREHTYSAPVGSVWGCQCEFPTGDALQAGWMQEASTALEWSDPSVRHVHGEGMKHILFPVLHLEGWLPERERRGVAAELCLLYTHCISPHPRAGYPHTFPCLSCFASLHSSHPWLQSEQGRWVEK